MRSTRTRAVIAGIAVASAAAILGAGIGPAQAATLGDREKVEAADAKPDPEFRARERAAGEGVVTTPASEAALATMQKRIASFVEENGTKYSFASYADPATGNIIVETDAPAELVASLTTLEDKALAEVKVETHEESTSDVFHRRDDIQPFWGGAGLSASGFLCSTGYAVKTFFGTRVMVTAGHCYANGTSVRTESGNNTVGTVSNRLLASLGSGPFDMELLGGRSYAGRVYTGGVFSTSSRPVVAAGSAVVGFNDYCHSGRTTGENCGHTATSITAQVCTQSGCKSPVISYTGGVIQQGGDSGGAFYARDSRGGAWIRGHVIAGNGTTGFIEPFTKVASRYGVSIVTG